MGGVNGSSIASGSQESISILEFYTRHRLVCLALEEFVSLSSITQSGRVEGMRERELLEREKERERVRERKRERDREWGGKKRRD